MYISSGLVLSQTGLLNPNLPRIAWQNYVSVTNVSATSELASNPASNLANSSTAFGWEATTADQQDIDVVLNGLEVDYIGIARHNLQQVAEIRIQVFAAGAYTTIFDWDNVPNRQALLYLINTASPDAIRISIRNNPVAPRLAVLKIGLATVLQRSIYVGHTPITMGRVTQKIGGVSESGQYLGQITRRRSLGTSISLQNLNALWYRETLDPIIGADPREPFFWAWRPGTYPEELAYAWIKGDPQPSNQRANGMMEISFDIEAIV